MNFAFTPEQEELRDTARAFLREQAGPDRVRAAMQTPLGYDPELWKRMGAELGWPAVAIAEAYGGLGLTWVELVALVEVMGEGLVPSPFFASVCLAANAIELVGNEAQRAELLPRIAAGELRATLALAEPSPGPTGDPSDLWSVDGIGCSARRDGDAYLISGDKRFVPDGHCADLLLVAARAAGSRGADGVNLFAIPADAEGLERAALETLDPTRRLAHLSLRDVRVEPAARLGDDAAAGPALCRALDRAAVALAAEQVGGAQRCLDLSVAHAKQRVQFGRPIGSFQAIKHKCADVMLRVESARSACYYAACVAAEDDDALPLAASLAKAYCSEAYFHAAAEAIQIHGGIGFTWESDLHLYFKRARASEHLLGEPSWHRERVARSLGL